jgi:hypothetical protein
LEKEKGFSFLFWLWAKIQLEVEPGPASRFCLPQSRVAQSRPSDPFRARSPVWPRGLPKPRQSPSSQKLTHTELTPRHRLPTTGLTPCRAWPASVSCRTRGCPGLFLLTHARTDLDSVRGKPSNRRQRKPNPNRLLANPFAKSRIQLEIRIGLLLRARPCLRPYK